MAKETDSRVYTYRSGKKVYLHKEPDKLVARAKPEELAELGIIGKKEKVSSASTRLTVNEENLNSAMEELRKNIVTHHAYKREDNDADFLITDRIIVTFKNPPSNDQLTAFMAKYALILKKKYSETEYLLQLTNGTGMNPVKLVVLINETESDLIESCEHDLNKIVQISTINLPSDAKYLQQWHLHKTFNHPSYDSRSSARCEEAWQVLENFGSGDVVIGLTDDGCKIDHSDFDSPNKFTDWGYMNGSSLITRDSVSSNPSNMYQHGSDHGTCCSGVIAAEVDGVLTVGAAPGSRLLPIKWESSGPGLFISDSKMLTVLNFISDKVDVLSNSWGSSPEFVFASNVINKITKLAINGGRRGKGIVFLWAAGNENCPIQFNGNVNIPYDNGYNQFGNWEGVSTSKVFEHNLVGISGVMHIAALSSFAQRSHYSNYGEGISLCAPSSNSHEYWRMSVTGLGILTSSGRSPFFDSEFGGTSSATPLVAGIAGLIISVNPNLTALEVVSVLQRTASKDLSMNGYPKTPGASYDPDTSWDVSPVAPFDKGDFQNINHPDGTWSPWFGFGKVDALAAVNEALRLLGGNAINNGIVTHSSSPSISIPDNNPAGISDVINVNEEGTVSSVKIDVNITHTYIGDLVVRIISPGHIPVILHSRNGSSANNIIKTYDIQNTPALSNFNGELIIGNWTLEITDLAVADTGILNEWTLQLGVASEETIMLNESPGVTIPDNNPVGIERSLNTSEDGKVKELKVELDITHSYIGDLLVNLISPKGTIVPLHNRTGGSSDNIIKSYSFTNTLSLKSFEGEKIQGTWKLKISDVAGQDIGKLNKWSLKILKN